jgi:hypothetical protein
MTTASKSNLSEEVAAVNPRLVLCRRNGNTKGVARLGIMMLKGVIEVERVLQSGVRSPDMA